MQRHFPRGLTTLRIVAIFAAVVTCLAACGAMARQAGPDKRAAKVPSAVVTQHHSRPTAMSSHSALASLWQP